MVLPSLLAGFWFLIWPPPPEPDDEDTDEA